MTRILMTVVLGAALLTGTASAATPKITNLKVAKEDAT